MGLGRTLILAGTALIVVGLLVTLMGRAPFRLGSLPGDFRFRGRNTTVYFPLATCILISVAASVLLWIFRK